MANPVSFPGDVIIPGNLRVQGDITPAKARSEMLALVDLQPFFIPWTHFRIWDAYHTNLGATPNSDDDLALVGGTFATDHPSIQTGDVKATSKTRRARVVISLPWEYVAGETIKLRFHAGMVTTVAGTSAMLDVEAYRSDEELGLSADLCTTAAQSINSLTMADIDFTITPTTFNPGDSMDVRITIDTVDAATGTAVIGCIGAVQLLCDVR